MRKKSAAAKRADTVRRRARIAVGTVKPKQVETPKTIRPPKHKKPPGEEDS